MDGESGYLKHPLLHRDEKGLERWLDRHNRYSSMEAVEVWRMQHGNAGGVSISASLTTPGPSRQRALKRFAHRVLPFRPLIHFLYFYLFKGAILDGRKGFQYSLLRAFYEYQVSLKVQELDDPCSPMRRRYRELLPRPDVREPR